MVNNKGIIIKKVLFGGNSGVVIHTQKVEWKPFFEVKTALTNWRISLRTNSK